MNVPENELFSAYVDGELTAAEQADVERLLAASPAARQLVEDLRALSSTLQCLPARKLDEDLSQQVLRLAEHRVLSGRTDAEPFSQEPVASPGRWQALVRRWSRPRIWVWPGLAVAVSLLLMVLNPGQSRRMAEAPGEKHVALAPAAPSGTAPELPAIGAPAEAMGERLADRLEAVRSTEGVNEEAEKAREKLERLSLTPAAAEATKDATAGQASNVPPESAPMVAKKEPPKEPPHPAAVPSASAASPAGRPMKTAVADLPADVRPAKGALGQLAEKAIELVTIVHCDVTQEAIEQRIVEQTLAKRQVVVLGRPARAVAGRGRTAGGGFAQLEMKEKQDVAAREWDVADADDARAALKGKAAADGKTVYLRAEATPAQLDAVLTDLRSQPTMVRFLARESRAANQVADGTVQSHFFGGATPVMKQKADAPPGASPATPPARRDVGGVTQTTEPLERFEANVQDPPAQSRPAGGARGASQTQTAQNQPATANAIQSESAMNRFQNAEVQRRAPAKSVHEGQEMVGQMRQKAINATQALGMRPAGPDANEAQADRKARQNAQQTDEDSFRAPADKVMHPAQQAMPGGQAGAMGGYGPLSPKLPGPKALAGVSLDAGSQAEIKRRVVFVLRPVDAAPIAGKAGKPQVAETKAAVTKSAPVHAEAAKSVDSSKPAAAAPPAVPAK